MANTLGYVIVGGFVATAVSLIVGALARLLAPRDTGELLKAVTNAFGTPLGFVLGYFYGISKAK